MSVNDLKLAELSAPTQEATDFIAHHGVKGMRWGFRRNSSGGYSRSGKKTKVLSEDAARAKSVSEKRKTSGTDALTNKEIKDLVERLNLEKQLNQLAPSKQDSGKKSVDQLLGRFGDQTRNKLADAAATAFSAALISQIKR